MVPNSFFDATCNEITFTIEEYNSKYFKNTLIIIENNNPLRGEKPQISPMRTQFII